MEMKTLTVNGKTYIVADPDAAHFDNSKPGDGAWSGKHTVDQLCPAFTESGSVVRCTPVEGYPLSVVSKLEPVQEGEGDPRLAGWSVVADVSVQADSPESVSIPADLLTYGQTYRLLVNAANAAGDRVRLSPACSMVAFNEGGGEESDITVGDYYIEFDYSSYGVEFSLVYEEAVDESAMFDIDGGDGRTLKDGVFVLQEYDPGNICPIIGHSEVKLWRGGRNLVDFPDYLTPTAVSVIRTAARGWFADFKENTQYSVSCEVLSNDASENVFWEWQYTDGTSNYSTSDEGGRAPTGIIKSTSTAGKTVSGVLFCYVNGSMTVTAQHFQLEEGENPTSYEPYRGEALTIDLGQTVYGGSLDWGNGVLTVTHCNTSSYAGEAVPEGWISSTGQLSEGAQVIYPLTEPITVRLTPQELLALSGENILYSDTGDTQVSGKADPGAIIEKLTNAIIALGGNI